VVPFESFRAEIEAAVLTPVNEKKSSAGRKPIDVMVMFRMLVLHEMHRIGKLVHHVLTALHCGLDVAVVIKSFRTRCLGQSDSAHGCRQSGG
jgi:hypothetical protein